MKYIYESHLGGLYCSNYELECHYCEQCGDNDRFLGTAETGKEALYVLLEDCYSKDTIYDFLREFEGKKQ